MNSIAKRNGSPEVVQETRAVIEGICHDVNSAMAAIVLCMEFLADQVGKQDAPAVTDARIAVGNIVAQMRKLRELSERAGTDGVGSRVFRT